MCNYVRKDRVMDEKQVMYEMARAFDSAKHPYDRVLLGTFGSILDPLESPRNVVGKMLDYVAENHTGTVILETHCTTIDDKTLDWVRERLGDRKIAIEMGLESSDSYVQNKILNKNISNNAFRQAIDTIHKHDMLASANVLVGGPVMNTAEIMKYAIQTARDAVAWGCDDIILFPLNIKPYTLTEWLYERDMCLPVSMHTFHRVLETLVQDTPVAWKLHTAWYGDHQHGYVITASAPVCCKKCEPEFVEFNRQLNRTFGMPDRAAVLQEMFANFKVPDCGCADITYELAPPPLSLEARTRIMVGTVKKQLLQANY